MNKFSISLLVFLFFNLSVVAQELKKEYQDMVLTFINSIKNENVDTLKTLVRFPLRRQYPLPDIKNEKELLSRYKELFDDSLSSQIINSNISKDWSAVGFRGIMLNRGIIWLDMDGSLIAVNYQSNYEKNKRDELIKKDRYSIHESLRDFDQPKILLETKNIRIRIDVMQNGLYRYASWPIKTSMFRKPEMIIENGTWMPEGNGGNNRFEFVYKDFIYECSINVIGPEEMPPADLTIYKNEKEIIYHSAKIIRN